MKAYQVIAQKHNLPVNLVRQVYESYLKLIHTKARETAEILKTKETLTPDDLNYNRGDYCFYLRYLGKYFINYKAYLKWKSKISKQLNQDLIT